MAVCKDRDAKAELNRRGQACEVLADTGISRRMKMEPLIYGDKRVARFYTVLQTVAWAARPTGRLNAEYGLRNAELRMPAEALVSAGTHVRLSASLNRSYLRICRTRALSRRGTRC